MSFPMTISRLHTLCGAVVMVLLAGAAAEEEMGFLAAAEETGFFAPTARMLQEEEEEPESSNPDIRTFGRWEMHKGGTFECWFNALVLERFGTMVDEAVSGRSGGIANPTLSDKCKKKLIDQHHGCRVSGKTEAERRTSECVLCSYCKMYAVTISFDAIEESHNHWKKYRDEHFYWHQDDAAPKTGREYWYAPYAPKKRVLRLIKSDLTQREKKRINDTLSKKYQHYLKMIFDRRDQIKYMKANPHCGACAKISRAVTMPKPQWDRMGGVGDDETRWGCMKSGGDGGIRLPRRCWDVKSNPLGEVPEE